MKSAFITRGVAIGLLGVSMVQLPVRAKPASLFAPILPQVRQQLPPGLKMRLPAAMPKRPVSLYPFVESNQQSLFIYLTTNARCKRAKCSIGGVAVFTDAGFSVWKPRLAKATPVALPQGIQGRYLKLGFGKEGDHYMIWRQGGSNYVVGVDHRAASKQELVTIASSMVSEPPIR
jgi:hypothetical protein